MEAIELLNYLEEYIQQDEEFFLNHQDELQVEDPQQKEIYEVTQGKIDMCRQVLSHLEVVRQHPEIIKESKWAA